MASSLLKEFAAGAETIVVENTKFVNVDLLKKINDRYIDDFSKMEAIRRDIL